MSQGYFDAEPRASRPVELWESMEHGSWPAIAAALVKPWPPEAAVHDLRWYETEAGMLGRAYPSVRKFAARWGWSPSRTQRLMSDNRR